MAADIVDLGFRVGTTDIDHAVKKLGLLDREFGKVERSGGLVARSFESVGESGKKSGGLVSRAFSEASQDIDKTLRSVTRLASEVGALARISRVDINVRLNAQSVHRELSDLRSRLGGGVLTLDINADLTRVTSEIASLRQSGGVNVNVTATADTSRAIAEIDALKRAASDVTMNITATADTGRALAELHSLRNQAGQIRLDIDVNVSGSATSAELNNVRDSVLGLNQAVLVGTRYLHDYNNELDRIRGSASDAADAIRRAADEQERLRNAGGGSGGGNGAAQSWMGLGNAIQFATGALGGFSLASAMTDTLQHARDIQRVSDALGVNTQALQEWELVAKKSGVEADKVADIFKDVSDKIGDFALTGGGEAKDLFDTLNLKIKDFKDLAPDKALEKMGEALKNSGLTRNQKVFLLEGLADDASLLLPKLENITEELAKARSIGEKSGSILSKADLAVLDEANKNIDALSAAWKGVSNNAGVAGASLLNAFSPALQTAIGKTAELFDSLGGYTSILASNADLLLAPLAAIGAYLAGTLITALASYIASITAATAGMTAGAVAAKMLGAALSLVGGPLGLIAISVGALTYALMDLSKQQSLEGKALKDLHGKYIDYHDITKTVVSYNAEYVNASTERKKAIIEETAALKANVLAEINALDARLKALQGNYQKAVMADAANAAPYIDDNGNLQYAVSLADKYKNQITELTEKIKELRAHYENIGVTEKAMNDGRVVSNNELKKTTEGTQQVTKALELQSAQLSITKQDQDLIAEGFRNAVDVLRTHEDALKSTVESLQKQRIELEHGSAAAKYYEDRLNDLSDAEAKAAAGSDQYNNYLKERNRLQAEAAGLSGGLLDEYNAKLKELGLDDSALDFSGIVDQTDAAVAAADNFKNALQGAEEFGKNLGETISKNMEQAAKAMNGVDHGFRVALGNMSAAQEKAIANSLGKTLTDMRSQMAKHANELSIINKVAAQSSLDPVMMKTMAWIESNFNGAANRGEKGAKGLYQFTPPTASDYGIRGSELNIEANTRAYVELLKDNMGQLRKFGIEINGANLYLAHQMGAEGLRQIKAEAAGTGRMSAEVRSNMLHNKPDNMNGSSAQAFLSAWQDKYAKFEAGIKHLTGAQGSLTVETHKTAAALQTGAVASQQTSLSTQEQLASLKYAGSIDDKRVTAAEILALRTQHMTNESNKLVKAANDQVNATQQSGYELRQNQLIQQQFNADAQSEILTRESMADYLAEERNIRLQMAAIRDPNAAYKAELAEKRLTDTQKQALMDQKAALEGEKVIKGLEDQALALQQNGQEQYATQLKAQGLSGAYLEQAKALNYSNTVVSIRKGLDLELKNTGLDEYQKYYNELIEQGISANDAYAFSQQKQLIAFGNLKKELEDEYKLIGLNNIQKYEAQKLAEGMSAAHAKEAAALYQRNRIAEATIAANDAFYLAQQAIGKTDEQLRALALTQSEGYPKSVAEAIAATEKQTSSLEKYRTSMQDLTKQRLILEARLQGGDKAARSVELSFEYANQAQRDGIQTAEEYNKKLEEAAKLAEGIGDALADALLSGNWKSAGDSILSDFKSALIDPLKQNLSDAIKSALTSGQNGGLLGGLKNQFNNFFGSISSSVGSLFGGGALGGVMGALAPVGIIAGVGALLKSLTKKDGNLVFGQGMTQGQQLTGQGGHNGQEHYRQTALGLIGATSGSNKIGREAGFVPEFHKALDVMQALDELIAKSLPGSVDKIKASLSGLEVKGFSIAEIMKQRYSTVLQSLPEALQKALTAGKNIADMSAEEIVARFKLIETATQSGLVPALESMKWAAGQSKEQVLALAIGLSDAAGGMDALKTKLDAYYQAAYTESEREVMGRQQARKLLNDYNKQLGLSGSQYIDTIAKLRARIEAEDKTTAAGQKNIATLLNMVEALKTLSGTAEEAAAKLKQQWTDFNAAAYTDSQRENIAKNQAQKLVDQFNKTYGTALSNIIDARQLMRTIDTTTEGGKKMQQALLGLTGSLVTLGGTAQQIKEKIAGLREGIKGLVTNLYSASSSTSISSGTSNTSAQEAALAAAQSTLDSLRSQLSNEEERTSTINDQAKAAYQSQLDYYRTLKDAAEDLRNVARGFADDARDAADTLKSAQIDYNQTLRAAQGGDVEAAKKLGEMANRLKSAVSISYNGDSRASLAIQQIEAQLRSTAGVLDGLAGTEPNDPGTISSTLIASLQSQISAQESLVSSLQSQISSASTAANEAKATADRAAMAKELATKIGELGLATDKSAWQILAQNGINIKDLAKDFGINVNQLDTTFVKKVAELSGLLNVNSLQLLSKIGVSVTDLASAYGINTDKLNAGMVGKIGELASTLNVNSFELLKKLGITTQELAAAYGLNTNNLNQTFLTKLDSLSDILKVSTVDMASKLGVNIDKLGDLMANKLASLPNIPADIRAGLAPHLQDIRNAADPATLQKELKELQTYVNSLPPGIKDRLNDQLQGILGYTGSTSTDTKDLNSVKNSGLLTAAHVEDLKTFTRERLMANGVALALQNARALNQNAANIGKASIPSYAIGSDKLPRDMLANVHSGEMIFTAAQSNSLRDLAIYNQSVIPRIASYLSDIAANDNQASVFIQPVINSPSRVNGLDRDELSEEVKGLRQDSKELKKEVAEWRRESASYSYAIANSADKSRRTLEKWDVDGLPQERTA